MSQHPKHKKGFSMTRATHVLVLANRTTDSDALLDALRARAARGPATFTLVVPEITTAARGRLESALQRMTEEGLAVTGKLANGDPMVALVENYDPKLHDEVIVATLPTGSSAWLGIDLPHRITRHTGAPVHHVVVEQPRQHPVLTPVEEAHHEAHHAPGPMSAIGSLFPRP
jgi:hypothetical protein